MSVDIGPAGTAKHASDGLVEAAFDIAYLGVKEYLKKHDLVVADGEKMLAAVRFQVRLNLPQAIADAKAAFEANLPKVALQTFTASMILAGIAAAKEVGLPKGGAA